MGQLGYKVMPDKIMEGTDGIIQVYSTTAGTDLNNLIATSSDSSIVKILGIEQDTIQSDYTIKISAVNAGGTSIALAAPGFSAIEFPITVYPNNGMQQQLLIKTTPSVFSTRGVTQGYVAIELANSDGLPTTAKQDMTVTLTTSNSDIVNLKDTQLVIKKGDYYSIGQFTVNSDGQAQIYASSGSLQSVSSTVNVNTVTQSYTIRTYVYPNMTDNYENTDTYVIAQLQDSLGNPVIADHNIPITVQINNATAPPSANLFNANTQAQSNALSTLACQNYNFCSSNSLIQSNAPLYIKKGSYWGYSTVQVGSGATGLYNITASAKGYMQSTNSAQMLTENNQYLDDKYPVMNILPILATGGHELIGVVHLENYTHYPVIASRNVDVAIDSSDTNTLSVDNTMISAGTGAALVFANVAKTVPNPVTLYVQSQESTPIIPDIHIPSTQSIHLAADPLIPKIPFNTSFPLALYSIDGSGAAIPFTKNLTPMINPRDAVQTEPQAIVAGQSISLVNSTFVKDGSATLTVSAGDLTTSITMQSSSFKPSAILLDHADQILSNTNATFSVEIVDGQQNPMIADKNINLQLVSSDPSVLETQNSVQIKKGSYYATFDAESKNAGTAEISLLSDELPLSKFDVTVTSYTPTISLQSTDRVDPNYPFNATVVASYLNSPLDNLAVGWNVTGAKIQSMDTSTNSNGKASIALVSGDPSPISITATVSGGPFAPTVASKQITVNPPLQPVSVAHLANTTVNSPKPFTIMGINPLFLIIPVAAGVAILVLKKREMLEEILEKIGLAEKLSGIKERFTEARQK